MNVPPPVGHPTSVTRILVSGLIAYPNSEVPTGMSPYPMVFKYPFTSSTYAMSSLTVFSWRNITSFPIMMELKYLLGKLVNSHFISLSCFQFVWSSDPIQTPSAKDMFTFNSLNAFRISSA
ncbi:hypothetical protein OGAPHI_004337 [Ogataea philodendri]|uniref:Uncharacterized protein n=1 Tax=Ogataea philodendri TaxID=1378263 RepID=A0A9P8P606_9ASCO|nr:uncharacterized protein OGAPHI_004337 [Ogataea philodendri]KAH3666148.1 hypothetical protein OGAPHI_004337 [Ogataea philodendri]